ncbi:hypothetical protein NL676_023565 [Syzygium grande]|nr:hypothetical protein NL676_023565 [Syzygium grande]
MDQSSTSSGPTCCPLSANATVEGDTLEGYCASTEKVEWLPAVEFGRTTHRMCLPLFTRPYENSDLVC